MNALILLAALFADPSQTPYSDYLAIVEKDRDASIVRLKSQIVEVEALIAKTVNARQKKDYQDDASKFRDRLGKLQAGEVLEFPLWESVPAIGDMGAVGGQVIEVIDEKTILLRSWYGPPATRRELMTEKEVVVQGIDTRGLVDNAPYHLKGASGIVSGTKKIGRRTYLLIEPITLEEIKKRAEQENAANKIQEK